MSKVALPRIYEYVADDGTVYYSLTRHPSTVSPPKRLVLQNKMGTILPNFIVNLRALGARLTGGSPAEDPSSGGGG
jgi:hypothetical protein